MALTKAINIFILFTTKLLLPRTFSHGTGNLFGAKERNLIPCHAFIHVVLQTLELLTNSGFGGQPNFEVN